MSVNRGLIVQLEHPHNGILCSALNKQQLCPCTRVCEGKKQGVERYIKDEMGNTYLLILLKELLEG